MRILLSFLLFAAACGSASPMSDGGGGGDLATSSAMCQTRADCRLFSSYCVTAACQCLAIGRTEVDPPCPQGTQSCLVDPCLNKSADCVNGRCAVAP